MKIFLLIVAVVLGSHLCQGSDMQRDGNWWRAQSHVTHYAYIMGITDGMDRAADLEKAHIDKEKFIPTSEQHFGIDWKLL